MNSKTQTDQARRAIDLMADAAPASGLDDGAFGEGFAPNLDRGNEGRLSQWPVARGISWGLAIGAIVIFVWSLLELLNGFDPSPSTQRAQRLLWACMGVQVLLSGVLMFRIYGVWRSQNRALASSRLFRRLVGFSILVAGAPAIVISITAVLVLQLGLQGWFGERLRSVVNQNLATANNFLDEHLASQESNALRLAQLISLTSIQGQGVAQAALTNPQVANEFLTFQAFQVGIGSVRLFAAEFEPSTDLAQSADSTPSAGIIGSGSGARDPGADSAAGSVRGSTTGSVRGSATDSATRSTTGSTRGSATDSGVDDLQDDILLETADDMSRDVDLQLLSEGGLLLQTDISEFVSTEDVFTLEQDSRPVGERILVLSEPNEPKFVAITPVSTAPGVYVLIVNTISPDILSTLDNSVGADSDFRRLSDSVSSFQSLFTLLFAVLALALALFAAWGGLRLAVELARPILRVTTAAQMLGEGKLGVRLPLNAKRRRNELDTLALTFNRMADDLGQQQSALRDANDSIEERRRFTEAVLAGVSAGVIGLDARGNINLPNESASHLLDKELVGHIGKPLGDVVPGFLTLMEAAHEDPSGIFSEEITITRRNGSPRQLLTNAVAEAPNGIVQGYVFTFDDVTDLQMAQRRAAWSDVARRIAHEIKNPLTPIQLSSERLKRRYLKDIENNPGLFSDLIDTIVRQVGEIGRMVDEFSSFARMPEPRMSDHDLRRIVRQAVFLQSNAFDQVEVQSLLPDKDISVVVDEQLMNQAVINLVKNAAENLEGLIASGKLDKGRVEVQVLEGQDPHDPDIRGVRIEVRDNGSGYPIDLLPKLMEPYVTTREKGTGLGLAIVRKVMEDHGGELRLLNGDSQENLCGARAILLLEG